MSSIQSSRCSNTMVCGAYSLKLVSGLCGVMICSTVLPERWSYSVYFKEEWSPCLVSVHLFIVCIPPSRGVDYQPLCVYAIQSVRDPRVTNYDDIIKEVCVCVLADI